MAQTYSFGCSIVETKHINLMSGIISNKDTRSATIIQLILDFLLYICDDSDLAKCTKILREWCIHTKKWLVWWHRVLVTQQNIFSNVAHAAHSIHNTWRKFGVKRSPFNMLRTLPYNVANLLSHFRSAGDFQVTCIQILYPILPS